MSRLLLLVCIVNAGCVGVAEGVGPDAGQGTLDAGVFVSVDAGLDAGALDGGQPDAGLDGSPVDAGLDAGAPLQVRIVVPEASDSLVAGEQLALEVLVVGGVGPWTVTWRSDHDGVFGSGAALTTSALSVNDHQVSALVSDAAGHSAQSGPLSIHVLPVAFDWSHQLRPNAPPAAGDWMSPVKNQSSCGACWAFAALGVIEAQWNIQNGDPDLDVDLSEQMLVDCFTSAIACGGGSYVQAMDPFVRTHGAALERCQPYQSTRQTCQATCADGSAPRLWRVTSATSYLPPTLGDKAAVQKWTRDQLVHHGPQGRHVGGMPSWDPVTLRCADLQTDHDVVVVGYDHAEGVWLLKNSWGPTWNGNGYFKVKYGECGMDGASTRVDAVVASP